MKILKSINIFVLSFVFLFAVACSGESKPTEAESETTTEEPVQVEEVESKPVMDSTTIQATDSVMTEAVDSVSAEG